MGKFLSAAAAAALFLSGAAGAADDADTIRTLRNESNTAMISHQVDKLMASLSDDFVLVGGSSGIAHSGKAALRDYFLEAFHDPGFVTYVRTPAAITVSDDGTRAVEHGHWQGIWRSDASQSFMGGDYLAHWSKRDGKWTDRAEVYVTLRCTGPICKP